MADAGTRPDTDPMLEVNRSGAVPAPRDGTRRGLCIIAALAVTQSIGYGVLYYPFSVFLTPMQHDLRVSGTQVAMAFTVAVLTTALGAPLAGRWLDAHGGRGLMTTGSILGMFAVLAWSRIDSLSQLYAVFAVIGVASAMALYEPAFAIVVSWFEGHQRANALLALTAIAGFSSSIFLPLSGFLVDRYGWRQALVVLAILYGGVAVPLHVLVLPSPSTGGRFSVGRGEIARAAMRKRPFWMLAATFSAHAGAVATVAVLLTSFLIHLGHRPVLAATMAGLLGVLSVTGRLVTTGLQRYFAPAILAVIIFALQGLAVLLLPLAGRSVPGAVGCVLLFGLGFGVGTITQPHLLAARYGTIAYATLSGRIALFSTTAKAIIPLGAVALAELLGYVTVMACVAVPCLIAALALFAYSRL